jgi:hypothetical protein
VDQALDYVLSRLATSYGQKADQIAKFIARGLRAEGWFAMEALHYLTSSTAVHTLWVEEVRGRSQGESGFNPDLQLRIGAQSHQLSIKSMPIAGELDHSHYFAAELPPLFRWMNDLKERAALVTIAYPCSTGDEPWSQAVSEAEEEHGVALVGQTDFVVPRPPLPMAKACIALWRHASVVHRRD